MGQKISRKQSMHRALAMYLPMGLLIVLGQNPRALGLAPKREQDRVLGQQGLGFCLQATHAILLLSADRLAFHTVPLPQS